MRTLSICPSAADQTMRVLSADPDTCARGTSE